MQAQSSTDLTAALDAQRRAFRAHVPRYDERLAALRALERRLLERQDDIAAAVACDFGGRSAVETIALELFPLLNELRHARRHLKRWMAPRRAAVQWPFWPATARVLYEPRGVVGIVSTWNYPLFLTLSPLVGALAAGNHALIKPSELAPATAGLIASLVAELFPATYVHVITGGADTAADFTRLPLDHLLFTGSTRVGKLVMKAASENLVPVTLELGGKSPVLVHPTYPIERAAARIVTGKLYTAGQTCVAPDYVLVPADRRDEFVGAATRRIARMYPRLVGNEDYTRVINRQHYRRLASLVEDARRSGAGVIQVNPGNEACDEINRVFPPTILTNVTDTMAVMQEEIFGPLLPVVTYDRLDDAVAYVNARPHPLALYYFDDDRARAGDVVARIAAGGATVNDCMFHVGQVGLPFGGVGASGLGRYHGFDGFETFSHKKGVFMQRSWSPLALFRPPYDATTRRLLRFLVPRR
jgi:coniferyl-aldehyde dehydrogenase